MRYVKILYQESVSPDRLQRAIARSAVIASDDTSSHIYQKVYTKVIYSHKSQRCSSSSIAVAKTRN